MFAWSYSFRNDDVIFKKIEIELCKESDIPIPYDQKSNLTFHMYPF